MVLSCCDGLVLLWWCVAEVVSSSVGSLLHWCRTVARVLVSCLLVSSSGGVWLMSCCDGLVLLWWCVAEVVLSSVGFLLSCCLLVELSSSVGVLLGGLASDLF